MEAPDHDRVPGRGYLIPERSVSAPTTADDTIDLTYLFWVWLKWSWVLVLAALVGAYFGYQKLQNFVPQAVAMMIVQPMLGSGGGANQNGLSSAAAQFGIIIETQLLAVAPFDRFKLTLGSLELAAKLQEQYGLLQRIRASSWDSVTQTWVRPTGEEFEREERKRAFLRQNLWSAPNLGTLAEYTRGQVKVEPASAIGFQKLSVQNVDGEYALWLLTTMFYQTDGLLREKDRQQSLDRRRFIERQMESRTMVHIQETLRTLLSQEMSKEITFSADLNYAADVVESPHVLNNRTEPNLPLLFGLPMVICGVGAFMLITIIALMRGERAARGRHLIT